jgi:hypothetical protein
MDYICGMHEGNIKILTDFMDRGHQGDCNVNGRIILK